MIRTESVRRLSTASTTRAFWSVSSVLRQSTLDSLPLPVRGNLSARVTTTGVGFWEAAESLFGFAYLFNGLPTLKGGPEGRFQSLINETEYEAAAADLLSLSHS